MSILRSDEFLITTSVGEISRRFKWPGHEPLDLDLPVGWVLERHGEQLRIRDSSIESAEDQVSEAVEFTTPAPLEFKSLSLPPARNQENGRPITVEILHLKPLDPVYLMRHQMAPQYPGNVPKQLTQFYGERYYLVRYRPVPTSRTVAEGPQSVFQYTKSGDGYDITPLSQGLRLKSQQESRSLPVGARLHLSERDFFSSTFIYGVQWWRFRMVPTPDSTRPVETEETEEDIREDNRFKYSAFTFVFAFIATIFFAYQQSLNVKPEPKIVANVEIKAPKILPPTKEDLKPKPPEPKVEPPPPKVVELKPEPPKIKPKEKPKKIAEAKPKAKKPSAAPKIAKVPPPPKPVKEPPAQAPEPPPPPSQAKTAKPVAPANTGGPAAEKAKETAAMQQQLAKSLGFLSTSSKRAAQDPVKYESKEGRFTNTPNLGGDVSKSTSLDKVIKDAPGDGTIRTNSSRTVASSLNFGSRKGKGLNDVQGKVSLGELYSGDGSKLGSAMGGGGGLSISGLGAVSEGEIEKALQKYMQRFQFCYEKALLSDASLGGKVVMQWTISTAGKGQSPKVVTSEMKSSDLHSCISKVLAEIPFPKPSGGTVQVKKTFSFSSSSI